MLLTSKRQKHRDDGAAIISDSDKSFSILGLRQTTENMVKSYFLNKKSVNVFKQHLILIFPIIAILILVSGCEKKCTCLPLKGKEAENYARCYAASKDLPQPDEQTLEKYRSEGIKVYDKKCPFHGDIK